MATNSSLPILNVLESFYWTSQNVSALKRLASILAVGTFALAVYSRYRRANTPSAKHDSIEKPSFEGDSNKTREAGEWTPITFLYPPVTPSKYDVSELKPVPYRPFRWGEYHVTMGIRSMPWDEWIELDYQFPSYYAIKARRIRERGEKVVRILSEQSGLVGSGRDAANELVHELAEYLSKRYPATFTVERHAPSKEGKDVTSSVGAIKTITIVPVNATYDLDTYNPMEVAGLLIQDDLAVMLEGTDGQYYFQAGSICLPGFWRISDKIGLSLADIHFTGNVPQFKEKLQTSMERFFRRMPVDKPVIRNNYFIQTVSPNSADSVDPEELAWSNTTNGPEDAFKHGHPFTPDPPPVPTPETLRLRTERQTLRRLPRSGAIVFTVRTYLFAVEELGKERGVPRRMASGVRAWGEDVQIYKGQALYRDVLLAYLDECHRKQMESGEIGSEPVKTVYPF